MKLRLLLLPFCLLALSAAQARADTLVIDSGLGVYKTGPWVLQDTQAGAVVMFPALGSVGGPPVGFGSPNPRIGEQIDLTGVGFDVVGTITVGGVTYPASGALLIRGQETLPYTPLTTPGTFSVFTTFTLSGGIIAYENAVFVAPIAFEHRWTGVGLAEAIVHYNGSSYNITQVRYNFGQAPGAVPEPATLLLLGTGLAGAVGAARRRRRVRGG